MTKRLKKASLSILLICVFTVLAFGALLTGLGMAFYGEFSNQWDNGDLIPANNTVIYDRAGQQVAELHGPEDRVILNFAQIPVQLRTAFLAVEDQRFYQHPGLDLKGIVRAALVDFKEGELAQGGSTITMQLVRNAFLSREKTWLRKVKELVMARELENRYSKDEILGMYLNRIYFGHGVYGVQSASRLYFGKKVDQLNTAEMALLAGIPKNPSYYSPYLNPEAAQERRNLVLTILENTGKLDALQADAARATPLQVAGMPGKQRQLYPYFVDQVIKEAKERYGISEEDLYRGGYKIYANLDQRIQAVAEGVMANQLYFPPNSAGVSVQGAMAVVDYHQGAVRALVGGRSYQTVRGFNRAVQLRRQPGSAIKPLVVFAPALEQGVPVSHRLNTQSAGVQGYNPHNYGGRNYGSIDMATALKNSVNTYAVKLLQEVGVEAGMQMGRALGLPLLESDRGLSLALGGLTQGVSPLQMAGAYGAFGADGRYQEPVTINKVVDGHGVELKGKQPKSTQAMSPRTARMMTVLLEEAVNAGTGREAQLTVKAGVYDVEAKAVLAQAASPQFFAAGKTGTVQLPDTAEFRGLRGEKDAWFVGYTPQLVAAVWIGFDHTDRNHYLNGVTGGSYPARLWKQVMERISPTN